MRPIPILLVSSRSDIAGGENYLLSVIRHMNRERFKPLVLLPGKGSFATALDRLGVDIFVIEADYGWVKLPIAWYRLLDGLDERVRRVISIIKEKGVRLVHTNSNIRFEGALAARLVGIPHLYLAHIELQTEMPIFQRFQINPLSFAQLMGDLSNHVVAVSRSVADALSPPLMPNKISVINNGLEFDSFDLASIESCGFVRRELGLPNNALVVATLGRIHPDKGTDFFVEVAAQVTQHAPNVHFVHAGIEDDKPFARQIRTRAVELGVETRIHFLGYRTDVLNVLADTDIFILPSRREGHPYVLLEAMATGCAVVASRCGGVDETISDGRNGYTVEIGDVGKMSQIVLTLVGDAQLRSQMGTRASTDVREHFDARNAAQSLFKIYDHLLSLPITPEGCVAVDFFLRATHELGNLGLHCVELDKRLQSIEQWIQLIKNSLPFRMARAARGVWTGRQHRRDIRRINVAVK